MALDFSHGIDNAFLEDNLLSAEDWGFHNDLMDSDIISDGPSFENFGISLGSDQFGIQDDSSSNSSTKSWNGLDDDFSSTIDIFEVKEEPSSPALSLVSTDSSTSQSGGSNLCSIIKLESPPLTPPHEVVIPATSPPHPLDTSQPLNLVKNGPRASSASKQNGYVITNDNAVMSNGLQIVNGNIPQGAQLINTNLNFVQSSNGILVGAPKMVVTTAQDRLPRNIIVNVVNSGTKRSANGTIRSGQRVGGARKLGNSAPKRDAKGVTIHPPIVPKSATVPSTVAVVTTMSAAKAIVFSNSINSYSEISPQTCQPSSVTIQQPITSPQPPDNIRNEKELVAWKRQQRMIKNRESASLSRKKKKEYVQTLEQKMQGVVKENESLKEENSALKKRLHALEEEVERLKSSSSPIISGISSPGRYATCLLTVILFIGINLSPFSLLGSNTQPDQYILPSHHGRSLLAFDEEGPVQNMSGSPAPQIADIIKDQYYNETLLRLHDESSQHLLRLAEVERALLLQQALNISYTKEQSQEMSSRLMEALEKLSGNKRMFQEYLVNEEEKGSDKPKKRAKKPRKKRRRNLEAQAASWQMESDERSLQIYDSFFIRHYENLINSLDRKHDTYYIVSFTRDHLLLPATSHNSTQRPKMSLVMPAGGNATAWNTPPDHMTMMQIDCEVTNTRTINMPDLKGHVIRNETEPEPASKVNDSTPPINVSSHHGVPTGGFKISPTARREEPTVSSHSDSFRNDGERYKKDNLTET